ncbi:MAG: bifunctional 4-hydroxy-2-oxoglutarate aldolase/2-dehydro-3-deoxy-phosphogluconate aldolase [Gammaproteobacteria bacterium]|nr:bifunctional 4-hydroxy-2-oxoglutarate aldolase/2-dehydro-3-deoxy-phosphogluconate aldolase [Gammaproteobacteria bacterium]
MATGPVIPVIVVDDPAHAVPMAKALVAGGVRVLELTLRTAAAMESIRRIAAEVPDAIVGAGTITRPEQFKEVREAGAVFTVTPGLTATLASAARDEGIALLPGVMTPSEIIAAAAAGFTALKFFPAVPAGGIAMLAAFQGPFGDITFCPTGGVTPANAPEFLRLSNVGCVGGSWLTPRKLMAAGDWAEIERLAREASALSR